MSELDFDRSLAPIMPMRNEWFNERIAELVGEAAGDEALLESVVIDFPRGLSAAKDIPMVEYVVGGVRG